MIIKTIKTEYELKEELEGTIYNYFSLLGLKTIISYINEYYREYEFNPCEFASRFTEYSNAVGSEFNIDDLVNDYDYLIEGEDDDAEEYTWINVANAIEYEGKEGVLWIQSDAVNGIVVVH